MLPIVFLPLIIGMQSTAPNRIFDEIAPLVVRSLHTYGKTMAASKSTGPIHVDVASFQATAKSLQESFDLARFISAAPATSRASTREAAIRCDDAGPAGRHQCFVADNGTYVAIDSMRRTPGGVEAYATITWTDRRRSGALSLGSQSLLLEFSRPSGAWQLVRRKVVRQT
jgi:hypothetical protein